MNESVSKDMMELDPSLHCTVIIPAYNEEKVLGTVLEHVLQVVGGSEGPHEILVVDDGSSDQTATIASQHDVTLVRHPVNRGYGAALKTGIDQARREIIIIIDADGTYPVEKIPVLLKDVASYHMVVGARTGEHVAIPWTRAPAKWFLRQLANYLSGTRIPDLNSGFRAFQKAAVLPFLHILPNGFSFTTTITLAMLTNDYLVQYIPIDYYHRVGDSKIRPIRDTAQFVNLILRTVMYFNPLKIFAPLSGLLLAAAIFLFFYSWWFADKIMDMSITLISMASVQVFVIGLLADLINKRGQRVH